MPSSHLERLNNEKVKAAKREEKSSLKKKKNEK